MKPRAFILLISAFAYIGCTTKSNTMIQQDENHWIVLEAADAVTSDEIREWEFVLNTPGTYNVQVFFEGVLDSMASEIVVETNDGVLSDTPRKIFVMGEKDDAYTIFQYGKNMVFKEAGLKEAKVKSAARFSKVRITPDYRRNLGFSTGRYDAQWEEMHNSPEKQAALNWFKEAKYGMFIHWGLYAQAGGMWKGVRMEDSGYPGPNVSEWLMFKFKIPRNEYAELAKSFNPDHTFAQKIAKLAKDAGMKYVVITSKHHDGFALFDSKCSEYDMVDATPYKADAIKELYDACLAEGLDFGVYYSHGNDWYDGTDGNYAHVKRVNDSLGILTHAPGKNLWDPGANTHAEYIENKALPQIKELLHAMPELRIIWFDGHGFMTEDQSFKFYKTVYDINPNVIVNRRVGYTFADYLDAGDNVIPSADAQMTKQWETCGTTNNSWAYKSYDEDWKSTKEMLYYLVDIAAKGGNYLLNIGPDEKGRVPAQSAKGLREVGDWLEINGDAIYGTSPWEIQHEGQEETLLEGTGHRAKTGFNRSFSPGEFWFTAKGNKVFAISLVSADLAAEIKSLNLVSGEVEDVRLLGSSAKLEWKQTEAALKVELAGVPTENNGYALEVVLKSD
jgi:alpha-L-fucosidase